jgi:ketosteroid isomerase-like protein
MIGEGLQYINIEDLITKTYAAFNARDIESVLAVMHPDVDWPNGFEEGRVRGHDELNQGAAEDWSGFLQWRTLPPLRHDALYCVCG